MDKILIEALKEKDKLVKAMNTIILSTNDNNGIPNSSYAPSCIDQNGNFYVYISELSKHTQNLLHDNKVSLMIIEDESQCENIFARKRFTMNAESSHLERESNVWNEKIKLFEEKFTEQMSFLKTLTDFHLFKITPYDGLLIHGFARAFRLTGAGLKQINYLNDKGHKKS